MDPAMHVKSAQRVHMDSSLLAVLMYVYFCSSSTAVDRCASLECQYSSAA